MEMQFLILGTRNIDRQEIANALAMIIEADSTWCPYSVYPDRDHHWVLDRSNNWRLNFSDHGRTLHVSYRYSQSDFGTELFAYIAKRMRWQMLNTKEQKQ